VSSAHITSWVSHYCAEVETPFTLWLMVIEGQSSKCVCVCVRARVRAYVRTVKELVLKTSICEVLVCWEFHLDEFRAFRKTI
jgi:hypothetical protein